MFYPFFYKSLKFNSYNKFIKYKFLKELRLSFFVLKISFSFMASSKPQSITKLQKQINRELSNLKIKRNFSLTTLPSSDSLRSSFSNSFKSIFFREDAKNNKKFFFNDRSPCPKFFAKEPKIGRSQDVITLKNIKIQTGKLKKKKSQGQARQFTTINRKQSYPTQVNSALSSFQSFTQNEYQKLIQKNKRNQEKIRDQTVLIKKLQQIIEQLAN